MQPKRTVAGTKLFAVPASQNGDIFWTANMLALPPSAKHWGGDPPKKLHGSPIKTMCWVAPKVHSTSKHETLAEECSEGEVCACVRACKGGNLGDEKLPRRKTAVCLDLL